MYSIENRKFVFKNTGGKVWSFFYEEKLGLCYTYQTSKSNWSDPVSLQKNISPPFYAEMDEKDCFHILYQDTHGNLFYTRMDTKTVKTVQVLSSKLPSPYDKHLFMHLWEDQVHLLYVILHNQSYLLAHQIVGVGGASTPRVVDYVIRHDVPYWPVCDKAGNLMVIYQNSDGRNLQLGCKKLDRSNNSWSEFVPITSNQSDNEHPRADVDSSGTIHLCYQRRIPRQFELVYLTRESGGSAWGSERVLHSSAYSFNNSGIVCVNDSLYVFWVREDAIYFTSSGDGGNSWSKPMKYNFPTGRQLACLSYRSNGISAQDTFFTQCIPGTTSPSLRIAFQSEQASNVTTPASDDLKAMIVESLNMLKTKVDELKIEQDSISSTLSGLSQSYQQLQRDSVKNSVRISSLESEVTRLKDANKKLQEHIIASRPKVTTDEDSSETIHNEETNIIEVIHPTEISFMDQPFPDELFEIEEFKGKLED